MIHSFQGWELSRLKRKRKIMAEKTKAKTLALTLEIGFAKSRDAHCMACGFQMIGGAEVGLCPRCGSERWYKINLKLCADLIKVGAICKAKSQNI
jgi:Zn finger protein HypA/HybF involved in hydrogenase expression